MIRVSIALVVGGIFLTIFGYKENKLASMADTEPQTLTAAQLAANGYGDNAHITLTDFWLLAKESVVEYPEGNESRYTKVWSPVISIDDPYTEQYLNADQNFSPSAYTGTVAVILYSKDINDDAEFSSVMNSGSVQGMIINEIDQISGEELTLLQQGLPGLNANTVMVLEHNRKPKSGGMTVLMMGGGVLLILAGPAVFFMSRKHA